MDVPGLLIRRSRLIIVLLLFLLARRRYEIILITNSGLFRTFVLAWLGMLCISLYFTPFDLPCPLLSSLISRDPGTTFGILQFRYRASACASMHTARYCFTISVCPSVRHTVVLYLNECIHRPTFQAFGRGITVVFRIHCSYKIPMVTPQHW